MTKPTLKQIASVLGCSVEQVKKQFTRNRDELLKMADKADRTGQKLNGYTAQQLRDMAAQQQR